MITEDIEVGSEHGQEDCNNVLNEANDPASESAEESDQSQHLIHIEGIGMDGLLGFVSQEMHTTVDPLPSSETTTTTSSALPLFTPPRGWNFVTKPIEIRFDQVDKDLLGSTRKVADHLIEKWLVCNQV